MNERSGHHTKLHAALICPDSYAQVEYGKERCCTSQVVQMCMRNIESSCVFVLSPG